MSNVKTSLKVASLAAVAMVSALLLSLTISAGTAHAVTDVSLNSLKSGTLQLSYGPTKLLKSVGFWGDTGQKVTNLKSSNKSVVVATLRYEPNRKCPIVTLKLKKAGASKVSFKLNGKKYAVKVKVCKYQQAIKSLTVGKELTKDEMSTKLMTRAVGGDYYIMTSSLSETNKVKVVAADGWKVKKIYKWKYVKKNGVLTSVPKTCANGSKIKGSFSIIMQNKKTGFKEYYYVGVF